MSLSALGFLAVYGLGLVLAFVRNPVFGLYSYLWTFYNEPSMRWWGADLPGLRFSLVAAVVTLLATLRTRSAAMRPPWHANWAGRLIIGLVGWMWIQGAWAINPAHHWEGVILFAKYLILFVILYRILANEGALKLFALAHVAGCFILGWIAFRTPVAGRLEVVLSPVIDDSNLVGMQLTTGLVFAGFVFLSLRGWSRWAVVAAIPFILNGIILTASRSAFLGLLAAGLVVVFSAPQGQRRLFYMAAGLGVILFLRLAGDVEGPFWTRIQTLQASAEGEMDQSAESRIEILQANWQMALDYPLGAGHRGNEALSSRYLRRELLNVHNVRSAHTTFFAVLVDHGFPGAILFALLQGWMILSLARLRRLARSTAPLIASYVAATGGAFAAYTVSGLFVNVFKAEIGIWLAAILAALDTLLRKMPGNDAPRNGAASGVLAIQSRIGPS